MQAGFVSGTDAVPGSLLLIAAVDTLLDRARAAGAAVIHLRNAGQPGALDERGSTSWELHRPPQSDEPVIDKSEDDGFIGTRLDDELRERGLRWLAICGVLSEMCVAATARGALARGYGVVLPHTAHATYDVPAGPGPSEAVPALLAARTAEWSLGDEVEIVADPTAVPFQPG
ncbi:isochorismatase family protein [Pseudonocardia sp. EC080625-04]|uniref:isochorismatase family protein n=1 Tax=Pseudonocardia sp. EC080625-04 TaxID=1096868 RepID=UPI0007611930|nr:isochorismatase family protein [Pseudonocardia sp. EC080625-04]